MSEALKPCPFCGSVNVDIFCSFRDKSTDINFVNVECIDCGAQGAAKLNAESAVQFWNNRAGDYS